MSYLEDMVVDLGRMSGIAAKGIALERFEADIPLDLRLVAGRDGPRVAAGYPGLMRLGAFQRPLGRLRITVTAEEGAP